MEINRLAPSWLVLPMGGLPRPIVGLIGVHLPEIQHLTQNRSESQLLQWGRLSQARAGHRVCEQKEV